MDSRVRNIKSREMYNVLESILKDKLSYEINDKLVKKYIAIKNFINNDTILEDGCLNENIKDISYLIDRHSNNFIIIITSTYSRYIKIDSPLKIKIDRKYNCLELI